MPSGQFVPGPAMPYGGPPVADQFNPPGQFGQPGQFAPPGQFGPGGQFPQDGRAPAGWAGADPLPPGAFQPGGFAARASGDPAAPYHPRSPIDGSSAAAEGRPGAARHDDTDDERVITPTTIYAPGSLITPSDGDSGSVPGGPGAPFADGRPGAPSGYGEPYGHGSGPAQHPYQAQDPYQGQPPYPASGQYPAAGPYPAQGGFPGPEGFAGPAGPGGPAAFRDGRGFTGQPGPPGQAPPPGFATGPGMPAGGNAFGGDPRQDAGARFGGGPAQPVPPGYPPTPGYHPARVWTSGRPAGAGRIRRAAPSARPLRPAAPAWSLHGQGQPGQYAGRDTRADTAVRGRATRTACRASRARLARSRASRRCPAATPRRTATKALPVSRRRGLLQDRRAIPDGWIIKGRPGSPGLGRADTPGSVTPALMRTARVSTAAATPMSSTKTALARLVRVVRAVRSVRPTSSARPISLARPISRPQADQPRPPDGGRGQASTDSLRAITAGIEGLTLDANPSADAGNAYGPDDPAYGPPGPDWYNQEQAARDEQAGAAPAREPVESANPAEAVQAAAQTAQAATTGSVEPDPTVVRGSSSRLDRRPRPVRTGSAPRPRAFRATDRDKRPPARSECGRRGPHHGGHRGASVG